MLGLGNGNAVTESFGNTPGAFTFLEVQLVRCTGHFKKNTSHVNNFHVYDPSSSPASTLSRIAVLLTPS